MILRADQALVDGHLQAADIVIEGSTITAVLLGDQAGAANVEVERVPSGTLLLPGNVDSHVHVNEPGRTRWEGFSTATEAAARGGITTIVDMPLNSIPPTIDVGSLALKKAIAGPKLHVDAGFWGGAVPENLGNLEPLWDAGVFGFKCFLSDSGVPEFRHLERAQFAVAMKEIASFGGLMIVHAEDPAVLNAVPAWSSRSYADFVLSRPDAAEVNAIQLVIDQVREHGTRAHILHLSSAKAIDLIQAAKAEGLPLTVETCPHYLVFDSEHVPDGAPEFKCCPPIRDAGNQKALWDALGEGIIDIVVSDHSPSTIEEKVKGGGDLALAWGGVSGLQVTFPTMVDEAAERGHDITRVSRWMSAGPAHMAGLKGKGAIAAGNDADLAFYEPGRAIAIDGSLLAHKNKLSAYSGRTLSGSVSKTIVRGQTAFDGTQVADPFARYLKRAS